MNIIDLDKYQESDLLSPDLMKLLLEEPDESEQLQMVYACQDRALEVSKKTLTRFNQTWKAAKKEWLQYQKQQKQKALQGEVVGQTNFRVEDAHNIPGIRNLKCGPDWIADEEGIRKLDLNGFSASYACRHAVLPVRRLYNMEDQIEKIELAYRHHGLGWTSVMVPAADLASAKSLIDLANYGLLVNQNNAKHLIDYLSDIQFYNNGIIDGIDTIVSSSKLGWHNKCSEFLPYDDKILFDGARDYAAVYEAVMEKGSKSKWFDHIKELRKSGRPELKIMLAASFSSAMVGFVDQLSYIVDLYGFTEGGKTVSLMVAASVWADPSESKYIGDFQTTAVALEVKADLLHSLPLMIDDSAKADQRLRDNMEAVIYQLCSGRGKARGNKSVTLDRTRTWQNCIITNGEKPLSSMCVQGGALNRIIEVYCGDGVYKNPAETAGIVKANYGFAGKMFIEKLKELGKDTVMEIYNGFVKQLKSDDKMQKQVNSVACILTADKIATDYLFQDGCYITLEEAKATMKDRDEVSENKRAYEAIMDEFDSNAFHFDVDPDKNVPEWGNVLEKDGRTWVRWNQTVLKDLCDKYNTTLSSFCMWCDHLGIIEKDNRGKYNKTVKLGNGRTARRVSILLTDLSKPKEEPIIIGQEEFLPLPEQEELPF